MKYKIYGPPYHTAAACQYGGNPVEGHEAGDDCASWVMEKRVPLQAEPQEAARTSGFGAEEVQDVHLCEWLLLAWTRNLIEHRT